MMLSRAGKFTEEIHMILKNKDEILAGGSAAAPKKGMAKSASMAKIQSSSDKVRYKPWSALLYSSIDFYLLMYRRRKHA